MEKVVNIHNNEDKSFSDWENYDEISHTYTKQRKTVGLDKMIDFFKPNIDMSLLDAGCGTGNYTSSMIGRFGYIYAGDFNNSMLNIAKSRCSTYTNNNTLIKFSQLNICDMYEISNESFNCAINCQVIHHLPKYYNNSNIPFEAVKHACSEWFRILKPGGKLVINFVTHEQQLNGVWWGELISDAVKRWQDNAPDKCDIKNALLSVGFLENDIIFEPVLPKYDGNKCLQNESLYNDILYNNPKNFLDIDTFKRSDSTFALATDNELMEAVNRVQDMLSKDILDNWYKERNNLYKKIGMTTNVYVTKRI